MGRSVEGRNYRQKGGTAHGVVAYTDNGKQRQCVVNSKYSQLTTKQSFLSMPRRRSGRRAAAAFVAPAPRAEPECELCQRAVRHVSRHHLVPREEGGRHGPVVPLCQPCHSTVHLLLSNRELARQYPTVEALRGAAELQKYLHWIRRSRVEHIANRRRKG